MNNIENFLQNIMPEPNTDCWLWFGYFNKSGYGKIGSKSHDGFNLAHRYSYKIFNGEFDRSLKVLHKCDNPSCVNPDHLFLGTQLENIKDRINKNRTANGERIPKSKLKEKDILEIRGLFRLGVSMSKISNAYGINDSAVSKIVNRKNWKHVN